MSQFDKHLIKQRLRRVPQKNLEIFLSQLKDITNLSKTRENLVEEIINYYFLMKTNKDFMLKFTDFIRDYVISAGESEYILKLSDPKKFLEWINSWKDNLIIGSKYSFYKHTHLEFQEKFLILEQNIDGIELGRIVTSCEINNEDKLQLSFPIDVIFLVAYSFDKKYIYSVNNIVEIQDTTEFEILFRKNSLMVEIRGNYKVIKDFWNSVKESIPEDINNAQTLFLGSFEQSRTTGLTIHKQSIDIDKLKLVLDGEYLDIDSPVDGDQAARIKISLKGMRDVNEETNPIINPVLTEVWKNQEKSRIGFCYNKVSYSFTVTKTGGLYFRQFAPEEVITYVLLKIQNLEA